MNVLKTYPGTGGLLPCAADAYSVAGAASCDYTSLTCPSSTFASGTAACLDIPPPKSVELRVTGETSNLDLNKIKNYNLNSRHGWMEWWCRYCNYQQCIRDKLWLCQCPLNISLLHMLYNLNCRRGWMEWWCRCCKYLRCIRY